MSEKNRHGSPNSRAVLGVGRYTPMASSVQDRSEGTGGEALAAKRLDSIRRILS